MPEITAEHIQLTAKLLEARDQLRRQLGEKYEAVVAPMRAGLKAQAESSGQRVLQVGMRQVAESQAKGKDTSAWVTIAATVDAVEGK